MFFMKGHSNNGQHLFKFNSLGILTGFLWVFPLRHVGLVMGIFYKFPLGHVTKLCPHCLKRRNISIAEFVKVIN